MYLSVQTVEISELKSETSLSQAEELSVRQQQGQQSYLVSLCTNSRNK